MSTNAEKKPSALRRLGDLVKARLQDPDLLRMAVLLAISALGLGSLGLPMYSKISGLQRDLAHEQERRELIRDYAHAKKMVQQYRKYTPKEADLNWWIEYILNASRQADVKVVEFKPFHQKGRQSRVGALEGTLLKFDLRGPYANIVNFIGRLENAPSRVCIVRVVVQRESEVAELKSSVTIGVLAKKKIEAKGAAPAQPGGGQAPLPGPGTAGGDPPGEKAPAPEPGAPDAAGGEGKS